MRALSTVLCFGLMLAGLPAMAQQVAFGGLRADTKAPVEIVSDTLSVDQETGLAVFSGNVRAKQGEMRMSSAELTVEYMGEDRSKIHFLRAAGDVILVSPTEQAQSDAAVYDVTTGQMVMTGNVLLTQGGSVMAGTQLDVDLKTGTGQMQGRVRTILQPGGN